MTLEEVDNLPTFTKFADKYRGIYQAAQGVVSEEGEYHLIVWDIQKRGNAPLKEMLTQNNHPAVMIRSKTTERKIHVGLIQTLNSL